MKEIIDEIVKKEQEAKEKIENAHNEAKKIISDAEKQVAEILKEAKLKASQISAEMIRNAEKEIERKKKHIIEKEKTKYDAIKSGWHNLIESTADRVLRKIIDIGYLAGKLFD